MGIQITDERDVYITGDGNEVDELIVNVIKWCERLWLPLLACEPEFSRERWEKSHGFGIYQFSKTITEHVKYH